MAFLPSIRRVSATSRSNNYTLFIFQFDFIAANNYIRVLKGTRRIIRFIRRNWRLAVSESCSWAWLRFCFYFRVKWIIVIVVCDPNLCRVGSEGDPHVRDYLVNFQITYEYMALASDTSANILTEMKTTTFNCLVNIAADTNANVITIV